MNSLRPYRFSGPAHSTALAPLHSCAAAPTVRPDGAECRKKKWAKGLYQVGSVLRYRRMVNGKTYFRTLGAIPLEKANELAKRLNLAAEEGVRLPAIPVPEKKPAPTVRACSTGAAPWTCGAAARSDGISFEDFSQTWLMKKRGEVCATSYARYRSVMDVFNYWLKHEARKDGISLKDVGYGLCADHFSHRRSTP